MGAIDSIRQRPRNVDLRCQFVLLLFLVRITPPPFQRALLPRTHHPPDHSFTLPKPDLAPPEREFHIPHIQRAADPAVRFLILFAFLRFFALSFPGRLRCATAGSPDTAQTAVAHVAPRAHQDGAHDVFDVLLQRDGEVFGARWRAAVGERFLVADWRQARGDVLRVREFGGEGGEGEGVVPEYGWFPVCLREKGGQLG